MIECSFDVIDLCIFVIYDVQYVAFAYGSKINWTFVFDEISQGYGLVISGVESRFQILKSR
jgi:hypothetical protein